MMRGIEKEIYMFSLTAVGIGRSPWPHRWPQSAMTDSHHWRVHTLQSPRCIALASFFLFGSTLASPLLVSRRDRRQTKKDCIFWNPLTFQRLSIIIRAVEIVRCPS